MESVLVKDREEWKKLKCGKTEAAAAQRMRIAIHSDSKSQRTKMLKSV